MSFSRIVRVAAFLLILISPLHAQSSGLWDIYEYDETVNIFLETQNVLENHELPEFEKKLKTELKLKNHFNLERTFIEAPTIANLEEIYGFKPKYDLRNFYILTLHPKEDCLWKPKNPIEFCRKVRNDSEGWGKFVLKSVEPDLPFSGYPIAEVLSTKCPDENSAPKDYSWHLRKMKIEKAWQYSETNNQPAKGLGVKIGHPDTGYTEHIDLNTQALEKCIGNNFLENNRLPIDPLGGIPIIKHPGHGTSTGSVIISRGDITAWPSTNSDTGTVSPGKITGVATEATLVPYRSIRSVIRLTYGNVIKAIKKAVEDNCSVISLSLGGLPSRTLKAAMENAIGNDVIIIAAAGNSSDISVVFPARYPFSIAVGATNFNNEPWKYSARGKEITVSAPGKAVWRAFSDKRHASNEKVKPGCGTSYSTANVAGVAALWLAHHNRSNLISEFRNKTKLHFVFKNILKKAVDPIQGHHGNEYGTGIVNAKLVLELEPEAVGIEAKKDFERFIAQEEDVDKELKKIGKCL